MLTLTNLTCYRDERLLFDALCFHVKAGEMVQIEGPNGAGKTSLLRIIAGLSAADSGEIRWQNRPIGKQRDIYHQQLLYLGHASGVKGVLTAFENLQFYQAARGRHSDEDAIWHALAQVDLVGYEDVPVIQLSAGQQRRVALARLWLSDHVLWLLDEPLTAIDKSGVAKLMALFETHCQQGGILLLTTHQDIDYPIRKLSLQGEALL